MEPRRAPTFLRVNISDLKYRLAIAWDWITGNVADKRELDNVLTDIANTKHQIAKVAVERQSIEAEIAQIATERQAIEAQLAAANARIAELEQNQKTASRLAQEIAASQGIPVSRLPASGAGAASTEAQLIEEFNAITDPDARGAFYEKHFSPKFHAQR
jgi:hypothetical protein